MRNQFAERQTYRIDEDLYVTIDPGEDRDDDLISINQVDGEESKNIHICRSDLFAILEICMDRAMGRIELAGASVRRGKLV